MISVPYSQAISFISDIEHKLDLLYIPHEVYSGILQYALRSRRDGHYFISVTIFFPPPFPDVFFGVIPRFPL